MKKETFARTLLILIALSSLLFTAGCGIFLGGDIVDIDTVVSPDTHYSVVLYQLGSPVFPFGSVRAEIRLEKDGEEIETYETEVADDGRNLGPENWTVTFSDDAVEILLHGSEQEDESITWELN